jgi:hypothetical protein
MNIENLWPVHPNTGRPPACGPINLALEGGGVPGGIDGQGSLTERDPIRPARDTGCHTQEWNQRRLTFL